MRRLLSLLTLLLVAVCSVACACGGQPTLTLRNPFQIDSEPATVAGPRMMAMPSYYAPSWTPAAGGCAPGFGGVPPGYSFAPRAGASPCNPQQ